MISLLLPLGLLGLIGVAVLIVLYIIKPNYQNKNVSSTFVWKLSLKYRKKKIPISKLRNILLILCQVMILVVCAFILARPAQVFTVELPSETIMIIDSSASMLASDSDEETRFERAVNKVRQAAETVFTDNGMVSVILADVKASFVAEKITKDDKDSLFAALDELIEGETVCSYGVADIDGAMDMCENILSTNPSAVIQLYTDTTYMYTPNDITIVDVSEPDEWNAAILSARTELVDNFYALYVEIACYGRDTALEVSVDVFGANAASAEDGGIDYTLDTSLTLENNEAKTLIMIAGDTTGMENENEEYYHLSDLEKFSSYHQIHIALKEDGRVVKDSLNIDDSYDLYDGLRPKIKVQYVSSLANGFFYGALMTLKNSYYRLDKWDIDIVEVKDDSFALEGFDFYIFEHTMPASPDKLPTDGVVLLADPDIPPLGAGINFDVQLEPYELSLPLTEGEAHPLTTYIDAGDITVSMYSRLTQYDPSYIPLMYCENTPVLLVKNEDREKIMLMMFSLHYSNISVIKGFFATLLYNAFEYFFPEPLSSSKNTGNEGKNLYGVYDEVTLGGTNSEVHVVGYRLDKTFDTFPSYFSVDTPGTYVISHSNDFGREFTDRIYVSIPSYESDIKRREEVLQSPYRAAVQTEYFNDLLFYIAIALVFFSFAEKALQINENV